MQEREEAREKERKKEKAIHVNHDGIKHKRKPRAREKTRVYVRSRVHEKDKRRKTSQRKGLQHD